MASLAGTYGWHKDVHVSLPYFAHACTNNRSTHCTDQQAWYHRDCPRPDMTTNQHLHRKQFLLKYECINISVAAFKSFSKDRLCLCSLLWYGYESTHCQP